MAIQTHSVSGIVGGRNPLEYSLSSPYTLFLFQAIFIILLCQLIYYPIRKLQQPKVIAEVVTGIILGPSVLGHVPNFTNSCFPKSSIPGLTLVANIGIILFLFIIGLEVDISFIKKNMKVAVSVGLINMAIPFALGCGIARGIYDEYRANDSGLAPIKFTTYMVFIAVAMCITAFPVLARILTELNLIGDRVGTIVLAAGITNDLTGWILLALAVTLANADQPVNTVYILLLTVAWFLFLCYPVRMFMRYSLRRFTSDLVTGEPSQLSMMLILVSVFTSAFYTDIIGVHPIFGAFMVGIIVPRDNGYVIKITEKLEDLVHIIFIPIYFALAGLNVNLGLLNNGTDWGYTIGIILLAMFGKIFGGFIAAKFNKLLWRESLAVGVLMSCKGIVEIVVLTVGLNAGIISQKVFSMFIVMALFTTFATTPLALWTYPVAYREKVDKYLKGEINWDGTPTGCDSDLSAKLLGESETSLSNLSIEQLNKYRISRIVLLLKRIDTISYLMTFVKNFSLTLDHADIKAIHLREFSSRTSHLLEASSSKNYENIINDSNEVEYNNSSSILSIIKVFSEVLGINFTSKSILSSFKNHAFSVNDQITEVSNFLISSIKACQLVENSVIESENNDLVLFKKLFQTCKSHFGLLLINERSKTKNRLSDISENYEAKTIIHEDINEVSKNLFELKSINLVLNHDNLLSSSDLLSLHVASKLSNNILDVNVFIKSSSTQSKGFENQIQSLFKSSNPTINLCIFYIKGSDHFVDGILGFKPNLANELFLIANNLATDDSLFSQSVNQLIELSIAESFNVLVVKAASN